MSRGKATLNIGVSIERLPNLKCITLGFMRSSHLRLKYIVLVKCVQVFQY